LFYAALILPYVKFPEITLLQYENFNFWTRSMALAFCQHDRLVRPLYDLMWNSLQSLYCNMTTLFFWRQSVALIFCLSDRLCTALVWPNELRPQYTYLIVFEIVSLSSNRECCPSKRLFCHQMVNQLWRFLHKLGLGNTSAIQTQTMLVV